METPNGGVYLITQASVSTHATEQIVEAALSGGVDIIQLREKGQSARNRYKRGQTLRQMTDTEDVPLIVNDRIDLAAAIDADGVHLGDDDLPVAVAREQLGTDAIIGRSVSTPDGARRAESAGADYLGVGAVYQTTSKADVDPEHNGIGIDGLEAVIEATSLPVFAIGGITPDRVPDVLAAGADGVAVISAIAGAENPQKATKALKQSVRSHGR